LEVEISGNDKTAKEAFYATELALTVGETVIESLLNRADLEEATTPGRYAKLDPNKWKDLVWDSVNSAKVKTEDVPSGLKVSAPPRYILGEWSFRRDSLRAGIGIQRGVYDFDVTAYGTGSSATSETILQSVYAKRYN